MFSLSFGSNATVDSKNGDKHIIYINLMLDFLYAIFILFEGKVAAIVENIDLS